MRSEEWQRQTEQRTTTKQKKHRAKRAKGPGTRPWSGSRGETHCGFLGQSPKRSLRQSLNRRKPTKAVQKIKEEQQTKEKNTKRCRSKTSAPLFYILIQSKIRKERSDFAAVELWCRGWRPRQPDFVCSIILAISAQFLLDNLADQCYNKKSRKLRKIEYSLQGDPSKKLG